MRTPGLALLAVSASPPPPLSWSMQISRPVPGPRQSLSRHFLRTAQLYKEQAAISPPNATFQITFSSSRGHPRLQRSEPLGIFSLRGLGSSGVARAVILAGRTCKPARESRRPRPSGGRVRVPPLPRSSLSSGCKCLWAPKSCPHSEWLGTCSQHGGSPRAGEARPGALGRGWWMLDAGG